MFSIVYLTVNDTISPILTETVVKHASIYNIPLFTLQFSRISSFGEFIRENVKTPYVLFVKETSYVHCKNIITLLSDKNSPVPDCICGHFVDNVIDVDAGVFIRVKLIESFAPPPFTSLSDLSKQFTSYISTQQGLSISVRYGFNVLNFEASYYHTHHCNQCVDSFSKSIVFTLGNMSDEEILKYHAIVEKIRVGKNVQIAIALMIKDEEQKIEETLNYYTNSNYFPEIFILDTGSTDKTLERVNDWASHHPLTNVVIYEQPFIDFSASRNYLLDHAYDESKCEYIMSVDCNDELKGQDKCIESLYIYSHFPAIFVDQIWRGQTGDPITFTNMRIVKNNKRYRWRYRVHEVMMADGENDIPLLVRLTPDVHLFQFREAEYEGVKSARYRRDLKFFLEDVEKYPEDKRLAYYLSQTYFFCQDYENCIISGKKRIALNKPDELDEECYQTILRIIKCKMFLGKEKYNVKKWMWYAWDYFAPQNKKDIEPLMQIAQFYETDDIDTAISLYELACNTAKPAFTLPIRNELYSFERYKRLAELYYKKRDFDKVYLNFNKILTYNPSNLSNETKSVETLLNVFYPSYHKKDKPVLVIYGGYFYDRPWNGKMFYEKTISLGGSESMVIKLAHLFAKEYYVYVFLNTDQELEYNGVQYVKVERYADFLTINQIRHLIVSRDANKLSMPFRTKVEHAHLWLHDLTESSELKEECYDTIITLTPFHRKFYEEYIAKTNLSPAAKSSIRSKLRIIPNIGGDSLASLTSYKSLKNNKDMEGYRFIYSSCPTRGLEKVVADFVEIKKVYSSAELYLYCDFNNDYVRGKMDVNALLSVISSTVGIHNIGRLPEHLFLEECKKANFWYYPTQFVETFCITAIQMLMNGVIPIYSKVGALPSLIDNAGIMIDENNKNNNILNILASLTSDKRNHLIKNGIDRVKQYTGENVKKQWTTLFDVKDVKDVKK